MPRKLVSVYRILVNSYNGDLFQLRGVVGSSKTRCFRRHRGDGFGSSKICGLDNFLTSFLGPRLAIEMVSQNL